MLILLEKFNHNNFLYPHQLYMYFLILRVQLWVFPTNTYKVFFSEVFSLAEPLTKVLPPMSSWLNVTTFILIMVHDPLFPWISTSKSQTGATPGLLPLALSRWWCSATQCTLSCHVNQSPPGTGPRLCSSLMCSRQGCHILDISADQIFPHCFNCHCRWTLVNWETLPENSSHLCKQNFFPVASAALGIQMHLCGGSSWICNEVQRIFLNYILYFISLPFNVLFFNVLETTFCCYHASIQRVFCSSHHNPLEVY